MDHVPFVVIVSTKLHRIPHHETATIHHRVLEIRQADPRQAQAGRLQTFSIVLVPAERIPPAIQKHHLEVEIEGGQIRCLQKMISISAISVAATYGFD